MNRLFVCVALLLLLVPFCFGKVKREHKGLVAALLPHDQLGLVDDAPGAIFKFDLYNPTSKPITFLKWGTPLEDKLYNSIFQVVNTKTNEPAPYIGIYAYRHLGKPTEDLFVTVQPGETIVSTIDITNSYDFSSEQGKAMFTISLDTVLVHFEGSFAELESTGLFESGWESAIKQVQLTSDPIQLVVAERDISEHPAIDQSLGVAYTGCNANQANALNSLMQRANGQATGALNYLNTRRCDTSYVTWFGVYDANRWNRVRQNFANILANINQNTYNYRCWQPGGTNCAQNGNSGVLAWVYPNNAYHEMNICDFMWRFDDASKAATLVHELSHFDNVAGTRDHGYGDSFCTSLARSDPNRAINNAANHHLFAQYGPRC